MKYLCCVLLTCWASGVYAQGPSAIPEESDFSCPYRPRIAEFTISNLYDYYTVSQSEVYGNRTIEIENEKQIKARIGVPIIMKKGTLFGLQLKYDRQKFIVDFEDNLPTELYQHIQSTTFKSIGGRFLFNKTIENRQYSALAGAELKSDELDWNLNTTKIYGSFSYKVELEENKTIGAGLGVSYTLAVFQIYPLFYYENQLSPKWTLDLALPKSAALRWRTSEKCFVSFKTELKGWRYAVHNNVLAEDETITLRKSDWRLGINFEHELYDWLWLGAEGGISKNLRHYLAKPGDRRRDALATLQSSDAPYFNFSIFIVPPKKLYQ